MPPIGTHAGGALPLMLAAWLLASPLRAQAPTPEPNLTGHWRGSIELPGDEIEFHLDLEADAAGQLSGRFAAPLRGLLDVPVERISIEGDEITFALAEVGGSTPVFEGRLSPDGRSIEGTYTQGRGVVPFTVRRAVDPIAELRQGLEPLLAVLRSDRELALGIVAHGEVAVHEDFADSLPVPLGSVTEVFTAFILGALVDEGRLDWTRPLAELAPRLVLDGDRPFAGTLTLQDLLAHRSGLPPHELPWRSRTELDGEALLESLPHLELAAPPYRDFLPSPLSPAIAGWLATSETGTAWDELVRSLILDPLEMAATTTRTDGIPPALEPALGMTSTLADLERFTLMLLAKGRKGRLLLVFPATLKELLRPRVLADRGFDGPLAFALGWYRDSFFGEPRAFRSSLGPGGSIALQVLPEQELGVVVLSSRAGDGRVPRIADLMAAAVAGRSVSAEEIERATTTRLESGPLEGSAAPELAPELVEALSGSFIHPAYGQLTVIGSGNFLRARLNDLDGTVGRDGNGKLVVSLSDGEATRAWLVPGLIPESGPVPWIEMVLKPGTPVIRFERRVEWEDRESILRQAAGSYRLGDEGVLAVRLLPDQRLRIDWPDRPPTYLEQTARPYHFTGTGDDGHREFFFVRAPLPNGRIGVIELLILSPSGEIAATRFR